MDAEMFEEIKAADNPADYVRVPRALLELCEVLIHENGWAHLPSEMHSDYDLALGQLRAYLSPTQST